MVKVVERLPVFDALPVRAASQGSVAGGGSGQLASRLNVEPCLLNPAGNGDCALKKIRLVGCKQFDRCKASGRLASGESDWFLRNLWACWWSFEAGTLLTPPPGGKRRAAHSYATAFGWMTAHLDPTSRHVGLGKWVILFWLDCLE